MQLQWLKIMLDIISRISPLINRLFNLVLHFLFGITFFFNRWQSETWWLLCFPEDLRITVWFFSLSFNFNSRAPFRCKSADCWNCRGGTLALAGRSRTEDRCCHRVERVDPSAALHAPMCNVNLKKKKNVNLYSFKCLTTDVWCI